MYVCVCSCTPKFSVVDDVTEISADYNFTPFTLSLFLPLCLSLSLSICLFLPFSLSVCLYSVVSNYLSLASIFYGATHLTISIFIVVKKDDPWGRDWRGFKD